MNKTLNFGWVRIQAYVSFGKTLSQEGKRYSQRLYAKETDHLPYCHIEFIKQLQGISWKTHHVTVSKNSKKIVNCEIVFYATYWLIIKDTTVEFQ